MSEVSEVRMPMRFIFILMGPVTKHLFMEDYHEIGRAMSTLMSYKVTSKSNIILFQFKKLCRT